MHIITKFKLNPVMTIDVQSVAEARQLQALLLRAINCLPPEAQPAFVDPLLDELEGCIELDEARASLRKKMENAALGWPARD